MHRLLTARGAPNGSHHGTTTEAEAFLQRRLVLLHKVLFFLAGGILLASILLLGFLHSWGEVVADFAQVHRWVHLALTLVFGAGWCIGTRWRLRAPALVAIDAIGLVVTSVVIAVMTARADSGHGGAMELVAAMLLILAVRAVIIPRTGLQTMLLSLAAAALSIGTFAWMAVHHPVHRLVLEQQTLLDTIVTMALWMSLMIGTATLASQVIYGLHREMRVAKRVGQYELVEKIGEGAMGVVYRANHALLRRETALKLLPNAHFTPERLERFEREVRQTARLTHPNTVAVFDYGRTPDGVFYYAMEYLEGIDLDRLVTWVGALPAPRVVHILRQILLSLTEAHEMGLIHRDIKPANVILTERGGEPDVIKVVDFGLVKDLKGPQSSGLTATGAITGTPLYLSPEAIRSPDDVSAASDLYAVAALGYFLLTGTHVFRSATVMEICAHHLHTKPEKPSERLGQPVPEALESLILKGLEKLPEQRFASARQFREQLDACREVPAWTEADATAWWSQHRAGLRSLRTNTPCSDVGQTVAIDFHFRHGPDEVPPGGLQVRSI